MSRHPNRIVPAGGTPSFIATLTLIMAITGGCGSGHSVQCKSTDMGCDCTFGGKGFGGEPGFSCPPVPITGISYVCGALSGWPTSGDCDCLRVSCVDGSANPAVPNCQCSTIEDPSLYTGTPLVAACPSAAICCQSTSGCTCYYGSSAPTSCTSPDTQVSSCDVADLIANSGPTLKPFDVLVPTCNPPVVTGTSTGSSGGTTGSSNCKHSGASCSSSSECCGGSICNSNSESSFYHECE